MLFPGVETLLPAFAFAFGPALHLAVAFAPPLAFAVAFAPALPPFKAASEANISPLEDMAGSPNWGGPNLNPQ